MYQKCFRMKRMTWIKRNKWKLMTDACNWYIKYQITYLLPHIEFSDAFLGVNKSNLFQSKWCKCWKSFMRLNCLSWVFLTETYCVNVNNNNMPYCFHQLIKFSQILESIHTKLRSLLEWRKNKTSFSGRHNYSEIFLAFLISMKRILSETCNLNFFLVNLWTRNFSDDGNLGLNSKENLKKVGSICAFI